MWMPLQSGMKIASSSEYIKDSGSHYTTADSVLSLPQVSLEAGRDILKQAGIPGGRPIIGISVRNWLDADRWTERFGRYLEKLKEEKVTVLFIPMQWPEDNRMAEKICQRGPECFHFLEGTFSAPELMSIIRIWICLWGCGCMR